MGRDGNRRGFTLVEIAVVLAVMGIVLVVATPSYQYLVLRARVSEAHGLVRAIAHAEALYHRDHGAYLACEATPATIPGPRGLPFDPTTGCWSALGFDPEGQVHYRYSVTIEEGALLVVAEGDLDGDGVLSRIALSDRGTLTTERELE